MEDLSYLLSNIRLQIEKEYQTQLNKNFIKQILMIYNDDFKSYDGYISWLEEWRNEYEEERKIEPNDTSLKVYIPVEPPAKLSKELYDFIKNY